jgi:predicted DNA-binding helix-hairpin-helix protein
MSQLQAFKKDGLSPLKKTLPMAAQKRIPAGQSTQMIVGASPSNDRSILLQSNYMYQSFRLKRVYYSGFSPIQDSHPFLPSQPPALVREHRLYQADWLMRFYQFSVDEITPSSHSSLDLQIDPKLMWAMRNRSFFPVNINFATQFQLLRVPGLGVRNVQRIIKARRFRALTLHDLKKMKVQLGKAKFFIQTADKNPYLRFLDRESFSIVPETQLSLFSERYSSLTGEV